MDSGGALRYSSKSLLLLTIPTVIADTTTSIPAKILARGLIKTGKAVVAFLIQKTYNSCDSKDAFHDDER